MQYKAYSGAALARAMSSTWKLRDANGPYKEDVYPPNSLLKLESSVCPIIPNNDVTQELTKYGKTIDKKMSIMPVASYPCLTPPLLMAISGSAWHQYIPSLHLFKLYAASLSVLRNTDGYEKCPRETTFKEMESRLVQEFIRDADAVRDEAHAEQAQKEFTFKSTRLLEYQILTVLRVDEAKWADLLSRQCDEVDVSNVNEQCKNECDVGTELLFKQRGTCTGKADTALAYNMFVRQSNSEVGS